MEDNINTDNVNTSKNNNNVKERAGWLQAVFEKIAIGMLLVDKEGRIVESNPAVQEILGHDEQELRGMNFTCFDLPEDVPEDVSLHECIMEGKLEHYQMEKRCTRKDGQCIWVNLNVSLIRDAKGKPQFALNVLEDVTWRRNVTDQLRALVEEGIVRLHKEISERKRAEESLKQYNRELSLINMVGRVFVSILDLDRVLLTVMEEARHMLGVVSCSIWLVDPVTRELVCRQITGPHDEVMRGWRLKSGEGIAGWVALHGESTNVPDTRKDARHFKGADRTTQLELRSILSVPLKVKGRIIGTLQAVDTAVNRFGSNDLTLLESLASMAAIAVDNAQLYEEADRLRAFNENIVHGVEGGIILFDSTGRLLFVNPKASEIIGYAPAELLGRHWKDIMPLEYHTRFEEEFASRLGRVIGNYETVMLTSRGEYVPVIISSRPLFDEGLFFGSISVIIDITERKRAEEALRESERRYRLLAENVTDVIWTMDKNLRFTYISPSVEILRGYTVEETMAQGLDAILTASSIEAAIKNPREEWSDDGEVGQQEGVRSWTQELEVTCKGGSTVWTETRASLLNDSDGKPSGLLGITRDVTERRRMQEALKESEERLRTVLQQRLAEMISEVSIENLLEFIETQARQLINIEGAAVLLLDETGEWLESPGPGVSWLRMARESRIPIKDSLAGQAITTRKAQVSNHAQFDADNVYIRRISKIEIHSLLYVPLIARGESLGVLVAWNKLNRAFSSFDSHIMELFADQAALALYNARMHARHRQLAIEEERHRLARELHDSVTQSLYSIGMAAQTSLRLLDSAGMGDSARSPVEHILSLSRMALTEMREQLYNLYPTVLVDRGLVETLERYCDLLVEQYPIQIDFSFVSELPASMVQTETLYYIAREALWNAVKHAGCTHMNVSLNVEDGNIILSIEDNGAGFDPAVFLLGETVGLRNMEERARLLGGTIDIKSETGHGTCVTARIPVLSSESDDSARSAPSM